MADNRQVCNSNDSSGSNSASNGPQQPDIFGNITPEEIVLIASLFAIAISEDLSDENATSLAFLFSTIGSNIGMFVDRRAKERTPNIPGVG